MIDTPSQPQQGTRRITFVLGMHQGGVDGFSRGLQALGVSLLGTASHSDEEHSQRCLQDADIVTLNDRLLAIVGKRWDSLALPRWEEWGPLLEPYKNSALKRVQKDIPSVPMLAIADPRVGRLLPFWQSLCATAGMQDSYVIVLRNPIDVARSLAIHHGFSADKSYLLWLQHMYWAVQGTQDRARVVVDYDELLIHPHEHLERVTAALGIPSSPALDRNIAGYAREVLSGSQESPSRESVQVEDDPRAGALVVKAYLLLRSVAKSANGSRQRAQHPSQDHLAFEHEWLALGQTLRDTETIFRYLDNCEKQIENLTQEPPLTDSPVQRPTRPSVPSSPADSGETVASQLRVTVVIPLYNHERYIETAIQSVLAQTYPPAEIIVVDDGSTDGSAEVMRHICEDHPEIIFWSWPNQGAHHALNAAIFRATGDFVAILNSDDYYAPGRLAACVATVEADPSVDAIATSVMFVDDAGVDTANDWYDEAIAFYRQEANLSLALLHANFLVSSSNLFVRRSLFQRLGVFSPLRYTHDLEFLLRVILADAHLYFLDRPLLVYRLHAENTISENKAREDIEKAGVFAFFLYRQWRADGTDEAMRTWLERYVSVLGRQRLQELVEYFLTLIERNERHSPAEIADSLATEFLGFLSRLGLDWVGSGGNRLLVQFVAARNAFIRRQEISSGDAGAIETLRVANAWLTQQDDASKTALEEMRGGNAWLKRQCDEWEAAVEAHQEQIERLNVALDEMRAGNAWLKRRCDEWEATVKDHQEQIERMNVALDEMRTGNDWHREQRDAWEAVAKAREAQLNSLSIALEEMRAAYAKLVQQQAK